MDKIKEYKEQLEFIQKNNVTTITTLPFTKQRFKIDVNTRTISIPSEFGFLGVQYDHCAETIYFEIDRYFEGEDLSKHTCVIQFENGQSEGTYSVEEYDLNTDENKIIFGWSICKDATQNIGDITFAVCFYSMVDGEFTYNFNTLPTNSKILKGLNISKTSIL